MIYTIVPLEQVISHDNEHIPYRSIRGHYMGEHVELAQSASGEYTIERLISTNPQSYLKSEFAPGVAVDMKKLSL